MSQLIVLILCELLVLLLVRWQKKMASSSQLRIRTYFDTWFSVIYALIITGLMIRQIYNPFLIDNPGMIVQVAFGMLPALIYLVYVLMLKLIIHPIAYKVFENVDMQSYYASFVYIQEAPGKIDKDWFVRKKVVSFVRMLSFVSMVLLVLVLIMEGITIYQDPMYSSLWFVLVICSYLITYTFALYAGGPVQVQIEDQAKASSVYGEELSNYAKAAEHLRSTFKDALLYFGRVHLEASIVSPEKKIRDLESSIDLSDHALASYFRNEQKSKTLHPDYIQIAQDLTNKKNVLVRHPFYQDLGTYLYVPISESLMEKHKVLILCAGNESVAPLSEWLKGLLDSKSVFQEQWRIRQLEELTPEADVGILPYSKLYDPQVLLKNRAFFEQTELVILLRPSQILTTMQIPLNVLSDLLRKGPVSPVFCILDQNMDRLKDTLSHVLKSRIHSDIAPMQDAEDKYLMIWDAESDFQAIERFERMPRFLGGGIEIGAEAVSADIPSSLWISQSNIPLADIQDTAAKSLRPIAQVMKTEASQLELRNRLPICINPWQMKQKNSGFMIVEDEFGNPFLAASHFASRAKKEVFVNVLADNYLLRDYFVAHADVFLSNPDAIPSLVPDFSKTRRNILLKLILQMMIEPMSEQEVIAELDLVDLHTKDPMNTLLELVHKYTFANEDLFFTTTRKESSYVSAPVITRYFGVYPEKFDQYFKKTLKNTSYLLEDEEAGKNILDSKLFSLIVQNTLPGQYINYGGRSYIVKSISPVNGVILRRSSDLIDSRKTYRQIRRYHLPDYSTIKPFFSTNVNNFSFNRYELDFTVDTLGYLEMRKRNDFNEAIYHEFHRDNEFHDFQRTYRNKTVLEIRFPAASSEQIYQIAMLLQELLISVLPDGAAYLSILAKRPENFSVKYSSVISDADDIEDHSLLVIEDSDMDLGLLDELENYFFRLMEIVQDCLRWTYESKKTKPEETRDVFEGADLDPSGFEAMTSEEINPEESEISKNSEILENSKNSKTPSIQNQTFSKSRTSISEQTAAENKRSLTNRGRSQSTKNNSEAKDKMNARSEVSDPNTPSKNSIYPKQSEQSETIKKAEGTKKLEKTRKAQSLLREDIEKALNQVPNSPDESEKPTAELTELKSTKNSQPAADTQNVKAKETPNRLAGKQTASTTSKRSASSTASARTGNPKKKKQTQESVKATKEIKGKAGDS